jgi:ketosteroid isomerase-like protein
MPFCNAYNAGDVDGAMEFYAEDAIVSDQSGYSVGSQAIREVVQEVVKQGFHF